MHFSNNSPLYMTAMMTTILLKHMPCLYFKLVTQRKCNLVCCKY